MFDKEMINEIDELLKEKNARRVMVQLPEGLKISAGKLIEELEKRGYECMLHVEPSFGACDLADRDAKMMGCDVLLHIGHAVFMKNTVMPVIYYEYFIDYDFTPLLAKHMQMLTNYKKIGLLTTVQFAKSMDRVKKFLESRGKVVFVGRNKRSGYEAQVLGCDFSAAKEIEEKVDCFLFLGSGKFHPAGFKTNKPFFVCDMEHGKVYNIGEEIRKMEIKRRLAIEKARNAKSFAIYVSTKGGQYNLSIAETLKERLINAGKNAFIIVANTLTKDKIEGMGVDVIVNTACPRLREDSKLFGKIILNPEDIMEMFK